VNKKRKNAEKMESSGASKDSTNKYELKLYNLFKSHDHKAAGSLDRESLLKLCVTLDLKERGETLVKSLITKSHKRVTFQEFREGLLNILADDSFNSPGKQNSRP
jgi:ninein